MRSKTVAAIVAAAAEIGRFDIEERQEYSGRYMFGATTDAVVYDNTQSLLVCVAQAAVNLSQEDQDDEDQISVEEFLEDIKKARFDSMGHSNIIY